jgi:hypothetical protein
VAWWNPFEKKPAVPERPPLPTVHQLCEGLPPGEQGRRLYDLILQAEREYDEMYEGRSPGGAYANMKDSMTDAIRLARELGLSDKVAMLARLLEHRQSVFRSQM